MNLLTVGVGCELTGGWGAAEARRRRDARYNVRDAVRYATEDGHAGRIQGWPAVAAHASRLGARVVVRDQEARTATTPCVFG